MGGVGGGGGPWEGGRLFYVFIAWQQAMQEGRPRGPTATTKKMEKDEKEEEEDVEEEEEEEGGGGGENDYWFSFLEEKVVGGLGVGGGVDEDL